MYLLFDIGGSKTRLALSEDLEQFSEPLIISTPFQPQEIVPILKKFLAEHNAENIVAGGFGGITGIWNRGRTELVHSPNLSGWVGEPVVDILSQAIKAPIKAENDADIVGLGEAVYGAGRGSDICVYVTISTGVGGVRLVDQKIDRSTVGFEPGHQIIDHSRIEEGDNYEGTLEGRISGTALEQKLGIPPFQIEDPQVWEGLAEETAVGIYNMILHWSPDTVVLGGSMIVGQPAIPVERVAYYVKNFGSVLPELPVIKKAELNSIGGLYGALSYAQSKLN